MISVTMWNTSYRETELGLKGAKNRVDTVGFASGVRSPFQCRNPNTLTDLLTENRKGKEQYCEKRESFEWVGSFASHAVWHESRLVKLPSGLDSQAAASLMCGGAIM